MTAERKTEIRSIVRRVLEIAVICVIGGISYWNIWVFDTTMAPPPVDELVTQEERYKQIPTLLSQEGYLKGPVGFITKRDLTSGEIVPEDDKRWGQAQYVMAPWIMLRKNSAVSGARMADANVPFIIADFWDGEPATIPNDLVRMYDSGTGIVLFRRIAR